MSTPTRFPSYPGFSGFLRSPGLPAMLCLLLAACTAPSPEPRGATAPPEPAPATSSAPAASSPPPVAQAEPPAPRMSDPLPPEVLRAPVSLDYGCRVAADCAVKNVGNCCGAMPACVNKDSPTDPAAVQAECARQGMASTCGFAEIRACSCVANRCVAESGTEPVSH